MRCFANSLCRVLLFSLLAVVCGPVLADEFHLDSIQEDILKVVDRVRPAVVNVGNSFSGVIVSPQGHVLSAAHAVQPGSRYRLMLPDGRRLRGIGKGSNPRTDCALIMIENPPPNLPFVAMGDSDSLSVNQPCVSLSYPGGQRSGKEPVIRFGRVISKNRRGMLQSSALMEPGDSGGPLFDLNGYVIGIHSRIGRSMSRNYEVPVNTFREFWNELNREEVFVQSGPPMPRLGVRAAPPNVQNREEDAGLRIISVVDDSFAGKVGLQANDRLTEFYGRKIKEVEDLRSALIAARDEGAKQISLKIDREEKSLDLQFDFDVEREGAPQVALPDKDYPSVPKTKGFEELTKLASQVSELEAKLDDVCVEISSELAGGENRTIVGTRVQGTHWIVSKSSVVGDNPEIQSADQKTSLTVVLRDSANDLVLLKTPKINHDGIRFDETDIELTAGTFVLTPEYDGAGFVSVVGSAPFRSSKQSSRGYLGVYPATADGNRGVILNQVVDDGAAKRAGLQVGDIITKLDDTTVRSQNDLRGFLMKVDPNAVISVTLLREEEELTKSITLGAVPTMSGHAADQMDKSLRRDGFSEVLLHDADLDPQECGGPLFDLNGKFIGLNIARNSRVRSFTLLASELKQFVDQAQSSEASE